MAGHESVENLELRLQQSGLPYYVQVRDQIIHAICAGRLKPGDKLPTVRAFSVKYGLAKDTVLHAYQELKRGGWVYNTPRVGTVVRDLIDREPHAPGSVAEVVTRFYDTLDQIYTLDIAAEAFPGIAPQLIAQRHSVEPASTPYLVLVLEDPKGAQQDRADMEAVIDHPVRWVSLQDLRTYGVWALGDIRLVRMVVSTFYRFEEIRERLSLLPVPVFPLTPTTDPQVVSEAVKYNRPETRVAVVSHDPGFIEPLGLFASQCLFDAHIVGYASLDDLDSARQLISNADVIAANFWAYYEQHADLTQGKPVLPLGTRIDPNGLQILRQMMDGSTGRSEAAVHPGVRSSNRRATG